MTFYLKKPQVKVKSRSNVKPVCIIFVTPSLTNSPNWGKFSGG